MMGPWSSRCAAEKSGARTSAQGACDTAEMGPTNGKPS